MLLRCQVASLDPERITRITRLLRTRSVHVRRTQRASELWAQVCRGGLDLAVVDLAMLGSRATEFMQSTHDSPLSPEVVFLTRDEDADSRTELLGIGALAVLNMEVEDELLAQALGSLLDRVEPLERPPPVGAGSQNPTLDDFVTRNPVMERFLDLVRRVAASDSSLLLQGETGVGKEWLARAIHGAGRRAAGPFIGLNCAGFPETLLDSELFGHEQGSFTGAVRSRRGHFELAHEGTIFLDEVGDMPMHMQSKLLRVLQEHEIMPVGSEEAIEIDVRVIAASNLDIEERCKNGHFRRDLHYRLGVITLEIPPLRARSEDIPDLVLRYAREIGQAKMSTPFEVEPAAMEILCAYQWPGNIRELVNVVERAILLARDPVVSSALLPFAIVGTPAGSEAPHLLQVNRPSSSVASSTDLRSIRRSAADAAERAHLTRLLGEFEGRVGMTARQAGISARALRARMRHLGLRKEDFRPVGLAEAAAGSTEGAHPPVTLT